MEYELAGEIELLGDNQPQCQFFHRKSHLSWSGIELGLLIFIPIDRYSIFLQNFDKYLPDYMASRLEDNNLHSHRLQNFKSDVEHEKVKDCEANCRKHFLRFVLK
jgi:hypothetical protein